MLFTYLLWRTGQHPIQQFQPFRCSKKRKFSLEDDLQTARRFKKATCRHSRKLKTACSPHCTYPVRRSGWALPHMTHETFFDGRQILLSFILGIAGLAETNEHRDIHKNHSKLICKVAKCIPIVGEKVGLNKYCTAPMAVRIMPVMSERSLCRNDHYGQGTWQHNLDVLNHLLSVTQQHTLTNGTG